MLLFAAALNALRPQGVPSVVPARPRVLANEALTAINGGLLFVLLAAVAITVLYIRPLLSVHYMVGFALIPPLALKLVSTGVRFGSGMRLGCVGRWELPSLPTHARNHRHNCLARSSGDMLLAARRGRGG